MAKLDSGGGDAQCDIQTVVDEQSARRPDGQTAGEFEML